MTDYAWFVVKSIFILILIGTVCWLTHSGWPLLGLGAMPSWVSDDKS